MILECSMDGWIGMGQRWMEVEWNRDDTVIERRWDGTEMGLDV